MLEAGETDVAVDELRWLLRGCDRLLEAHKLLGDIALAENDVELARVHFGYAYQLGLAALKSAPDGARLPYEAEPNRPFHEAGKGLVVCLLAKGQRGLAEQVVRRLVALDSSDPLAVARLVAGDLPDGPSGGGQS